MNTRSFGVLVSCIFLLAAVPPASGQARTTFQGVFAPTEDFVLPPEKPARQSLCLNGSWQFQPVAVPADFKAISGAPPELTPPDPQKWEATRIKIPSPWNVNEWGNGPDAGDGTKRPFVADSVYFPSYPPEWSGARMGWLKRSFRVPADWGQRRMVLHFEAVAGEAQVLVNGKPAGNHFDSFLPFDCDVTDLVRRDGADNELLVGVRKSSLFDRVSPGYPEKQSRTSPNGSAMDNLVGIWNDVFLVGLPAVRAEDVFIQPQVAQQTLLAEVTLRNDTRAAQTLSVGGEISPWVNLASQDVLSAAEPKWRLDKPVAAFAPQGVSVPPGTATTVTLRLPITGQLKPWTPDSPNLYGLVVRTTADGTVADLKYIRFGWRQFTIEGRDLRLNGQRIQLFGDFTHPFGPYIGSRRFVSAFFGMIKSMGGNATRPHAQPMPRFWLDLADEMGLCVVDEGAVFGSSINLNLREPETWERLDAHVDGLVRRDRNHPSVFGWSPANEMFALFLHTSEADKAQGYERLRKLALRPRALDPTREWLSVDGDKDLDGALPVWSRHLGLGLPEALPDSDKPRMIGEQGGTYFAGPPRLRELAGDRPYESYAARNEILAADLYRMIVQGAKPDLAFFSPSELMWFGLEHLPFGYTTDTRPPGKEDGVFFPRYREDTPGVQIERLPPYAMTINPGLDPKLPVFRPLAMYEAMKAALDPRGPQPCPWDKLPAVPPARKQPAPANTVTRVGFIGRAGGPVFTGLTALGLPLAQGADAAHAPVLVIDAESLGAADADTARQAANAVWQEGGLVWVMVRHANVPLTPLAGLLPARITLTERQATSLIRGVPHPAIDGFNLADLYFVSKEGEVPTTIQEAGLGGPLVKTGKVLLTAANTDWSLFEHRPESAKCSSMLIYEHLRKPSGVCLVETAVGRGRLWVSTLNPAEEGETSKAFWRQLWQNVGVRLESNQLAWLSPVGKDAVWHYTTNPPPEGWTKAEFSDAGWSSGAGGFGTQVPRNKLNTPWQTSDIYLRRTFNVATLPRTLNLVVYHDDDAEVYLNGTRIFSESGFIADYRTVPLSAELMKALRPGENLLAVHCKQTTGGQYIDAGLAAGGLPGQSPRAHDLLLDGPLGD